jgi:hypothetical protein
MSPLRAAGVHVRRNWITDKFPGSLAGEEVLRWFLLMRIQPVVNVGQWKNNGHPIMDGFHHTGGCLSEKAERFDNLTSGAMPDFP